MSYEEPSDDGDSVTVLVTGFGVEKARPPSGSIKLTTAQEFQDIKINPSWEIASQLPSTLDFKGINIRIITQTEPLKAAYHSLFDVTPKLLQQYNPDIVLHVGLAVERDYFAIEHGANRDGYQQYPDVARKVFTKAEIKKAWGKSPERLDSPLDFDDVVAKWKAQVGKGVDVRASDDVGTYVCGFVYYTSMEYFWKRGTPETPVVFMHVPPLSGKGDLEKGKAVTLSLIQAIAQSCRK
ncbi:hypothetical protein G7Y89_g10246 [Cudoniella acicularis]|uniref:Peptidase C15, pyroglutamyl peptidase I-like protein n=1 Tax=Cudoniella acicularis TaxID=354080 RepID=A0A8H4RFG8_9HELO|nr:hypothetical protein G7Y89_g10246 [Cudoniella acicularis]